jgi:hypothetical protein
LQAVPLPFVVRFARLPVDTSVDEERHLAETTLADVAAAAIEQVATELGSGPHVIERVQHELDKERKLLAADHAADDPLVRYNDQYTSLRLALIARQREALLELRDERSIDDIVLRQVQGRLDIEEVRLSRSSSTE